MRGLIALFVTMIGGLIIFAGNVPVDATVVDTPKKVFVCKYVGTPGVDERLQTGQNPISVSVNAIQNNQWDGVTVPAWFSDAHDRSYVLAYDEGQEEPSAEDCPAYPSASVSTLPATCETGETLVYGEVYNATFSGTADGTVGPAEYEVIATADEGYYFDGEQTTKEFSGDLAGPLTGEECEEADISYTVACSTEAEGSVVVTFVNNGDGDGEATLNGEVVALASGATIEKTIALTDGSADVTIVIDGETVYDQSVECASDDDGEVLGGGTKTPTPEVLPYTAGDSTVGVVAFITAATAGIGIVGAIGRRLLSSNV